MLYNDKRIVSKFNNLLTILDITITLTYIMSC